MPGYFIYTMEEFTSLLTINSVGLLRDFIGVVIGMAVTVGFIVVTMAMYTAVLERTREIGILKALGASSGYILNLLFRETLLVPNVSGGTDRASLKSLRPACVRGQCGTILTIRRIGLGVVRSRLCSPLNKRYPPALRLAPLISPSF